MTKNKQNTKQKLEQASTKAPYGRKLPGELQRSEDHPEDHTPAIQELTEFWQAEVKEVMSQSFSSVEAAVDAIIERVTNRFAVKGSAKKRMEEFLQTALLTDPGLLEQIKKDLKISK